MGLCKHKMIIDGQSYDLNDNAHKAIHDTLMGFSGSSVRAAVMVKYVPGPNELSALDKCKEILGMLDPDKGIPKKIVREIITIIEG